MTRKPMKAKYYEKVKTVDLLLHKNYKNKKTFYHYFWIKTMDEINKNKIR